MGNIGTITSIYEIRIRTMFWRGNFEGGQESEFEKLLKENASVIDGTNRA